MGDEVLEGVVKDAIRYAAAKSENGDLALALAKAAICDPWILFYMTRSCAEGIARYFGTRFAEVNEVYVAGLEGDDEIEPFYPVIVVVCVESGAAAIAAVARDIEAKLPPWLTKEASLPVSAARNMINVVVVDRTEVSNRSGFGALIGALWSQPIRLWSRQRAE